MWFILFVCYVTTTAWVFSDAKRRAEADAPVVVSFGAFTLSTPSEWLAACVIGWVIALPVYLTNRDSAKSA